MCGVLSGLEALGPVGAYDFSEQSSALPRPGAQPCWFSSSPAAKKVSHGGQAVTILVSTGTLSPRDPPASDSTAVASSFEGESIQSISAPGESFRLSNPPMRSEAAQHAFGSPLVQGPPLDGCRAGASVQASGAAPSPSANPAPESADGDAAASGHAAPVTAPQPATPDAGVPDAAVQEEAEVAQVALPDHLDISLLASAVAASKLGLVDQLSSALTSSAQVALAKDAEERTCLHYAAGYGHEEIVSLLLDAGGDTRVRDVNGDVPLHFAAIHGHPMCAYNIAKACPATCLVRNLRGQTPVEVAVACERGEVLNAMLLACAGDGTSGVAVQGMRKLLASGAVPDTWAPNGSSALMLAAAANGVEALRVLLEAGATLELQDALGRSALMFSAGNCAAGTLVVLLDSGACIAQRDRRGRNVLDYAPENSDVRKLLHERLGKLEAVAAKRQQDLLASLEGTSDGASRPSAKANKNKKKAAARKAARAKAKQGAEGDDAAASGEGAAVVKGEGMAAGNGSGATLLPLMAEPPVAVTSIAESAPASCGPAPSATAAAKQEAAPSRSSSADDDNPSEWRTVSTHKPVSKRQHAGGELEPAAAHVAVAAPSAAAMGRPPRTAAPALSILSAKVGCKSVAAPPPAPHTPPHSKDGSSAGCSIAAHLAAEGARHKRSSLSSQSCSSQDHVQHTFAPPFSAMQGFLSAVNGKRIKAPAITLAGCSTTAVVSTYGFKAALLGATDCPAPAKQAAQDPPPQPSQQQQPAPECWTAPPVAAPAPSCASQQQARAPGSGTSGSATAAASAKGKKPVAWGSSAGGQGELLQDAVVGLSPRSFPPLCASAVVGSHTVPSSCCHGSESGATPLDSSGAATASSCGQVALSSSPVSFGCDWSRPSPVDMWQAAFAASATRAEAAATAPPGKDNVLPPALSSHSRTSSDVSDHRTIDIPATTGAVRTVGLACDPISSRNATGGRGASLLFAAAAPGLQQHADRKACPLELTRLRSENDTLKRQLRQAEQRHCQELASVLQDAVQHEADSIEVTLAQERLRITTNLLAIGLCPQAILAVITPLGHMTNLATAPDVSASNGSRGSAAGAPVAAQPAEDAAMGISPPLSMSRMAQADKPSLAMPIPGQNEYSSSHRSTGDLLSASFGASLGAGSFCGGLGLAAIASAAGLDSGMARGPCADEEDDEDGWDLPACGDISAMLLDMSDDEGA